MYSCCHYSVYTMQLMLVCKMYSCCHYSVYTMRLLLEYKMYSCCHYSVYTMQLMLECKNYATKGWPSVKKKEFTFNDVGRSAFGFPGKFAVDLNVIFCNLGVCAGYIIFIASNLQVSW